MKKRAALLVALSLAVVTVLAGCGGKDSSKSADSKDSAATFEEKKEGDTFTVGFDQDFPPMGFVGDDGEYTGFDLELAKEVCDRNGWEFNPEPIAWDSKDALLKSGEIDCIWNGFTINGREDDYTWTDPYINNEQVIVVAKDSGIEKLADLKGKNVVVQAASAALDALNNDDNKDLKDSFASLTENPDYNTAFMNIDSGAADAVAVDIGVANYQLSQRGKDKYVILDEPIQNEQYGIGFKKGNDELKDLVWAEVEKLDESGEVDKLADKYELDKSMLCISEDKEDASDSDSAEADTEESADSTEKEADSESK